jgi:hypothetical protein
MTAASAALDHAIMARNPTISISHKKEPKPLSEFESPHCVAVVFGVMSQICCALSTYARHRQSKIYSSGESNAANVS